MSECSKGGSKLPKWTNSFPKAKTLCFQCRFAPVKTITRANLRKGQIFLKVKKLSSEEGSVFTIFIANADFGPVGAPLHVTNH